MEQVCLKQEDWGKLWALMKTCTDHVIEGDKVNGFRDRLLNVEIDNKSIHNEMCELKRRFWWASAIGGVIGALLGSGSRDILLFFINWLVGK